MRIAVVEDNRPLADGIARAFRDDGHGVDARLQLERPGSAEGLPQDVAEAALLLELGHGLARHVHVVSQHGMLVLPAAGRRDDDVDLRSAVVRFLDRR